MRVASLYSPFERETLLGERTTLFFALIGGRQRAALAFESTHYSSHRSSAHSSSLRV